MKKKRSIVVTILAILLLLSSATVIANTDDQQTDEQGTVQEENTVEEQDATGEQDSSEEQQPAAEGQSIDEQKQNNENEKAVGENPLPNEKEFELVAENENLLLKADRGTGHFILENKETGKILRSFPNPNGWDKGTTADVWQVHLQSPLMFTYVEFNVRKDVVKESNFTSQGGEIDFEKIDDGFKVTYTMPKLDFSIPVEVRLGKDFVETKVLADEIVDEKDKEKEKETENEKADPKNRLVSLKVFPFLGAETSENEDGYLFLPDGPGALVKFQQNRASTNNLYKERIYGEDMAFSANTAFSQRQPIRMPTFGIKSENQSFLGIVHEGDAYTGINAAPSQTLTQYNWVTSEHLLRFKFFQPTNRKTSAGFFTYSEKMQRETRTIRYYPLNGDNPGYVDMATKYREYLMEENGINRMEKKDHIALQLNILGGGTKPGFIMDSFLSMTNTSEAAQIVKELNSSGVENMDIQYLGWQRGGYDKAGGHYPVAKKLGGNDGMKDFVDFAHKKGFSVYLDASSYTFNNTNRDGFRASRDALRDLSSTIIKGYYFYSDNVLVSPRFMEKTVMKDLKKANKLQVDGYLFGDGIGAVLSTDYNEKYFASRENVKEIQQNIIKEAKEKLGKARVTNANFYGIQNIDHIELMDSEYSFDLFVDQAIPFAQIALHGLLTYSLEYGNRTESTENNYLKGIEYGALPSYILTYGESHELVESRSLRRFYSTHYKDWEEEIASQYQHYNEALADVQHQFIVDHQMIAEGVYETTYEEGKRIYVNYNPFPYHHQDLLIEPENYLIVGGRE